MFIRAERQYLIGMFRTVGIEEEIKSKLVTVRPSEPVGEVVAGGDAEIGFHQLHELLPVKGIQIVGMLPLDLGHFTVFSGAVHREANQPVAAKAILSFLIASTATESIKKHGLDR
jgi:molybdate transport system substrate-binding protein